MIGKSALLVLAAMCAMALGLALPDHLQQHGQSFGFSQHGGLTRDQGFGGFNQHDSGFGSFGQHGSISHDQGFSGFNQHDSGFGINNGFGGSSISYDPSHYPDIIQGFPFQNSYPGRGFSGCDNWCFSSFQNNYYCCTRTSYSG
ncbi:filaggrin-2-like [Macrobrachium nipponense]|uniref:filaggrin-2-like n=1 Tax=Macrobrachium nipponense TaxID=159736 RepID=UPI0030C8631F